MRTKTNYLIAALLLAAGLTACGDSEPKAANTGQPGQDQTPALTTEAAQPATDPFKSSLPKETLQQKAEPIPQEHINLQPVTCTSNSAQQRCQKHAKK